MFHKRDTFFKILLLLQGALETAQRNEDHLMSTVSENKVLIDQLENEKTRYKHDAANLRDKLAQTEGKSSEVNHKYKEQVIL